MSRWHIITGEYPPQPGGVSDYTYLVAYELAKTGDEVEVWAPECRQEQLQDADIQIHRLPGRFGPRALAILDRAISDANSSRLLVQYVPHAFGWKAMNLPFCCWLYARRRRNITVMFHEVVFPKSATQRLRHKLIGTITPVMAMLAAKAAARIFIASSSWENVLRPMLPVGWPITLLPVPSNVPLVNDEDGIQTIRERYTLPEELLVGHFGTYAPRTGEYLEMLLRELVRNRRLRVICFGRGGKIFCEQLIRQYRSFVGRVHGVGELDEAQLSLHLSACDLMIQPYPDGISTRRGSAMAALSHGRAVVTTKGASTEALWSASDAVVMAPIGDIGPLTEAVTNLLNDDRERQRLGRNARKLYLDHFDVRHTIAALRRA